MRVCIDGCRLAAGVDCVASSPTVACLRSSQNVHSPSLKSVAIFFPCLISTSRSTLACVRSISISVDLSTSAVISGVVEYEDMPDIKELLCCRGGLWLSALVFFTPAFRLSRRGGCLIKGIVPSAVLVGESSDRVRVCLEPENTVLLDVRVPLSSAFLRSISCCNHAPDPSSSS